MPKRRLVFKRQYGKFYSNGAHFELTADDAIDSQQGLHLRNVLRELDGGGVIATNIYEWVADYEPKPWRPPSPAAAKQGMDCSAAEQRAEAERKVAESPPPVTPATPQGNFLTREQVRKKTGLSKATLMRLHDQGLLLARKSPRATKQSHVKYREDEVDAYMATYEAKPRAR